MVYIINLYKTAAIEEANEALKKLQHQVEKYYSLLPKDKQRHIAEKQSCKHALHH
jgi:hypothetical protein